MARPLAPSRGCRVCGVRYRQRRSGGMCRRCARLQPVPAFVRAPDNARAVTIQGVAYEVVWP